MTYGLKEKLIGVYLSNILVNIIIA